MAINADPLFKSTTFMNHIDELSRLTPRDPAKRKVEEKCAQLFSSTVSGSYVRTGMKAPFLFCKKNEVIQRCPLITNPPEPYSQEREIDYARNNQGHPIPETVVCARMVKIGGHNIFKETTEFQYNNEGIKSIKVVHEKTNLRKHSY